LIFKAIRRKEAKNIPKQEMNIPTRETIYPTKKKGYNNYIESRGRGIFFAHLITSILNPN
jgi:hypothetical protein